MAFLLDRWFGLILNQRTSWDAFIVCGLPLCGAVPLDRAGRPRPALTRPGGRAAGEGARPTRLSASALSILTWDTTLVKLTDGNFLEEHDIVIAVVLQSKPPGHRPEPASW